jgi:hypothetical protein
VYVSVRKSYFWTRNVATITRNGKIKLIREIKIKPCFGVFIMA